MKRYILFVLAVLSLFDSVAIAGVAAGSLTALPANSLSMYLIPIISFTALAILLAWRTIRSK